MIDRYETSVGNLMPFVPFQADEHGPGFICGESFLWEVLPKAGWTTEQIDEYIESLMSVPVTESDWKETLDMSAKESKRVH